MNLNALDDILDPQGETFDGILNWVNERIDTIRKTDFSPDVKMTFVPVELYEEFSHSCGVEASATWRKFFMAALLADWACYDTPVDRADFARLKFIMSSAYKYTRLWFCRLPDGKFIPVGYTAWYPIAKFVYDGVIENPADVDDRGVFMPLRFIAPQNIRYAYVFNISITKELFNTSCSRQLTRALLRDGLRFPYVRKLAITVAQEGLRLSKLAHFVPAGKITVQGEAETLSVQRIGD